MNNTKLQEYLSNLIQNTPLDWIKLTTHRLDIYNEQRAKTDFLAQLESLFLKADSSQDSLIALPTAYDYIRLGHPLSSILEWAIAKELGIDASQVISFGSQTTAVLAILRHNALAHKKTRIIHNGNLPQSFNSNIIRSMYDYNFEIASIEDKEATDNFDGSLILISDQENTTHFELNNNADFYINTKEHLGSILVINNANASYVTDIQHVRRRETIAMTPENCFTSLKAMVTESPIIATPRDQSHKQAVIQTINKVTNTTAKAVVGSSGLSIQYAIMMGLVHHAREQHPNKPIRFVVPPNCYGGTNDQARRIAASVANVAVVDLPVDRDNDMVSSTEDVLNQLAQEDAVPYIIAEIPTNPRVEVPELEALQTALAKTRNTPNGTKAIAPIFILDQTFCPNVHFLGKDDYLGKVQALAYASGSKFPSGGKCIAGYCVANDKAAHLIDAIALHLDLCDNEATSQQYKILAEQMPSMINRIAEAYANTRDFVTFIENTLPEAKINFVSENLAKEGFTPSVFSLDLPTKGDTPQKQEAYKRALNLKLINMMINQIPDESKYCVSYGQLKGVYWTIPATSTQGTTKEGDKDYIIRASFSANLDMRQHKLVFQEFVDGL